MKQRIRKKGGLTALLVAGMLVMAGCGASDSKKEVSIDTAVLADSLATGITYEDSLEQISEKEVGIYYELEEGVSSHVYMGSGSTAEEVAVFEAKDEASAKLQKEHVQAHLDEQEESFRDYLPEEVKRIEGAVLEQRGKYVVLCVTKDASAAKEMIEKAFQ